MTHNLVRAIAAAIAMLSASTYALEPLPKDLSNMVIEFSLLEESFREGEWNEAEEVLEQVNSLYQRVQPQLMKAASTPADREKVRAFASQADALRVAFEAKQQADSEGLFHKIQILVVDYIDWFAFDEHPMLAFFKEELEEAEQELQFDQLVSEAKEWETLIDPIKLSLKKRGRNTDIFNRFHSEILSLAEAANAENESSSRASIGRIKLLVAELEAEFK